MARKGVHPIVVPLLVAAALVAAFVTGKYHQIPSYIWETEGLPVPANSVTETLKVRGLKCRHGSEGMHALLFGRTDENAVKGYLKALVFNDPTAGDLVVTYDPAKTSPRLIAKAVKYGPDGQETSTYRVLLHINPDRKSPEALLRTVAEALADQHLELFQACHADGALVGLDFAKACAAFGELFLDSLAPAGKPDAQGRIQVQGVAAGVATPLADFGITMGPITLIKDAKGWLIKQANWGALGG